MCSRIATSIQLPANACMLAEKVPSLVVVQQLPGDFRRIGVDQKRDVEVAQGFLDGRRQKRVKKQPSQGEQAINGPTPPYLGFRLQHLHVL